jgi:hypothetical protein
VKLNIPDRIRDFHERNLLRKSVGLPLVSMEAELAYLRRLLELEREAEFDAWCRSEAELERRIEEKWLAKHRRWRGDPNWKPTGWLSGGGWMMPTGSMTRCVGFFECGGARPHIDFLFLRLFQPSHQPQPSLTSETGSHVNLMDAWGRRPGWTRNPRSLGEGVAQPGAIGYPDEARQSPTGFGTDELC